jgi:hypothetical protein
MQMKIESPAAAGTANGADIQDWLSWINNNMQRELAARRFIAALDACHPDDRLSLLEIALDALRPGFPMPLLGGIMDEAHFWAERATRVQRKAYLWACYSHLPEEDQAAFFAHITRRAVA